MSFRAELPSLPHTLPGENLFSRVCRYRVLVDEPWCRTLLDRLLSAPFAIAAASLPTRLHSLRNYFAMAESPETIAEICTILPYLRPFLSPEQWTRLRLSLYSQSAVGLGFACGLASSRVTPRSELRLCEECMNEDVSNFGIAYWHRVHQLPGVLVCPKHSIGLRSASLVFRHSRHGLWLPREVWPKCKPPQAFSASERVVLCSIASVSDQLLDGRTKPVGADGLRAAYLKRARSIGMVTEGGSVRQRHLAEAFTSRWEGLRHLRDFAWVFSSNWAATLLRQPRSTKHPLYTTLGMAARSSTRNETGARSQLGAISLRKRAVPMPSGTACSRASSEETKVP